MKKDFTSINFVIDSSGSMARLIKDTIGGFNTLLAEQKSEPGEAIVTLCTFSSDATIIYDCVPLQSVPELTTDNYRTSGNTALLDALGATINHMGEKISAMPEDERPSKVLFVIITDGEENASKKYMVEEIHSMITHQRDKYSWEFVFTGANIDSCTTGSSLGISTSNAVNYSASMEGTSKLYDGLSKGVTQYRSSAVNMFDASALNKLSK